MDQAVEQIRTMFPNYSDETIHNIILNCRKFFIKLDNDLNAAIEFIMGGDQKQTRDMFKQREEDKCIPENYQGKYDYDSSFQPKLSLGKELKKI